MVGMAEPDGRERPLVVERASPRQEPAPLSPLTAFTLLALMAAAAGGLALARAAEPGSDVSTHHARARPQATPAARPGAEASAAHAKDTFRHLHELVLEAVHDRDVALMSRLLTRDSPDRTRSLGAVRDLRRMGVYDRIEVTTTALELLDHGPRTIVVRQTAVLDYCFVTEAGEDVTDGPRRVRHAVVWTLRPERGVWRIHGIEGGRSTILRERDGNCAG